MRLGPWEIVAVLSVVLLVFGPSKLPSLGKGVGEFLHNLKKGLKEVETETKDFSNLQSQGPKS